MNIRQVKSRGKLEKYKGSPRIVRNIDMLKRKNYLVDFAHKAKRNDEEENGKEQSPVEYAIDKNQSALQKSVAAVPTGVYKIYKRKTERCIKKECRKIESFEENSIHAVKKQSKEIPIHLKQEKEPICVGLEPAKTKQGENRNFNTQLHNYDAKPTINNMPLKRSFAKSSASTHKQKPILINRGEIVSLKENKIAKNNLLIAPVSKKITYRNIKPESVTLQKQAYFYAQRAAPMNSYVTMAANKQILQKKMKYRMIQEPLKTQTLKRFTVLQYMKDFSITALRAAAITGGQFLLFLGGAILLILVIFFALLSAIAASPFGILLSNEAVEAGTMPLSAAIASVQTDFTREIETLQTADNYAEVYISGNYAELEEVVAVFAVYTTGNKEAISADVITINEEKLQSLKAVFWDMTQISTRVDTRLIVIDEETAYIEKDLYIQIKAKTAMEQAAEYRFTNRQIDALYELLSQKVLLSGLIHNIGIVGSDIKALIKSLPENILPERKSVVEKALSLVGKVNYFWGGKSLILGWDDDWGILQKVTAAGSPTTGSYRLYGLDCSGFIDWVFYNASGGHYIISNGGGVAAQRANCTEIAWENAKEGDLVFYEDNSHAGIICGRDGQENLLIVHCTSGNINNVVITDQSGFDCVGRPNYYNEWSD